MLARLRLVDDAHFDLLRFYALDLTLFRAILQAGLVEVERELSGQAGLGLGVAAEDDFDVFFTGVELTEIPTGLHKWLFIFYRILLVEDLGDLVSDDILFSDGFCKTLRFLRDELLCVLDLEFAVRVLC